MPDQDGRVVQRSVCVLGATGVIGGHTLDIIRANPERYRVGALSGNTNLALLQQLAAEFPEAAIVTGTAEQAQQLASRRRCERVSYGPEGLLEIASDPQTEIVVAGITGSAGLPSTLAAVRAGKRILIANKEALIIAGELLIETAKASRAEIVPVDSEHSAILQCLPPECAEACVHPWKQPTQSPYGEISRLWLTASGGPLWTVPSADWADVSVEQACNHPVWKMGRKISVDSATMVNKALELMEASVLFGLPHQKIEVLVHPQGVVHGLVEFIDGSQIASLGVADMRGPIGYGLSWPERLPQKSQTLDLTEVAGLEFHHLDERFNAVALAREAINLGQGGMIAYNACNEIAVNAFLHKKINFDCIVLCIEHGLKQAYRGQVNCIEDIYGVQNQATIYANEWIACTS